MVVIFKKKIIFYKLPLNRNKFMYRYKKKLEISSSFFKKKKKLYPPTLVLKFKWKFYMLKKPTPDNTQTNNCTHSSSLSHSSPHFNQHSKALTKMINLILIFGCHSYVLLTISLSVLFCRNNGCSYFLNWYIVFWINIFSFIFKLFYTSILLFFFFEKLGI